jgi:hypothetical protein
MFGISPKSLHPWRNGERYRGSLQDRAGSGGGAQSHLD